MISMRTRHKIEVLYDKAEKYFLTLGLIGFLSGIGSIMYSNYLPTKASEKIARVYSIEEELEKSVHAKEFIKDSKRLGYYMSLQQEYDGLIARPEVKEESNKIKQKQTNYCVLGILLAVIAALPLARGIQSKLEDYSENLRKYSPF